MTKEQEGGGHQLPQPGALVHGKMYNFLIGDDYEEIIKKAGKALGLTNVETTEIALKTDTSLHQLKDTVLHELIHAIDYSVELGLKEKQVHVLAASLCDLFWSNPNLSNWIVNREAVACLKKTKAKKKRAKKPSSSKPDKWAEQPD